MSQTPEEKDLTLSEETAAPIEEAAEPAKKAVAYDESLFEGSTVFAKPKEETKKPGLKPSVKGMILAGVAVLTAGAVGLTVLLLPKNGNGGSNVPSNMLSPVYGVTDLSKVDLVEAKLYNASGTLRFYPEASEATTSSAEDEEASVRWLVEGYENYNLSGAATLVEAAKAVSSEKRLDAKAGQPLADDFADRLDTLRYGAEAGDEDESVYGFDRPFAAMTMTSDKGETTLLLIGDYAPDSSGRYVTASGKDGVFIINESDFGTGRYAFSSAPADLIDPTAVAAVTQGEGMEDYFVEGQLGAMDSISLSGTHLTTPLTFTMAPEDLEALTYIVAKPAARATNEDNVDALLKVAGSGFSAAGAYKLGYTAADLDEYGLTKPYTKLEIQIASWHTSISFGKEIDGYYPFIVEGSDVIYKVSTDACEWVSYPAKDFYFDSLFLEYISNIREMVVETEEKEVTFHLNREGEGSSFDFTVTADGYEDVEITNEQLSFYYSRILALTEEEAATSNSPTDKPYLTFRFRYVKEGKKEDVITLYRYSTRRYLFRLNGEGSSLVAAGVVQDLHDSLDALLAGEEIGRAKYS